MSITLDLQDRSLLLQILRGDSWSTDLEKLKAIDGRKWSGKFWELPWFQLRDVLETWPASQIIFKTPRLQVLKDSLTEFEKPWNSLAPYLGPLATGVPLRTYQEKYVRINHGRHRLLCAWEMGVGKTLASLERAKALGVQRLLIVCPKVVKENWRSEARRVLGECQIYHGTPAQRRKKVPNLGDLVITTYEMAAELATLVESGQVLQFDQIIIDEVHLIKDPTKLRFKNLEKLVRLQKNAGIQCLSGTPIQHRLRDLWAPLHLLNPLLVGGYAAFADKFTYPVKWNTVKYTPKTKSGRPALDENGKPLVIVTRKPCAWKTKNLGELQKLLDALSYRVTREHITTFEDSVETTIVELTDRQRFMYDQIRDNILIELQDRSLSLRHVPVRLLRLLQAAEGLFNFQLDNESGKLEYIRHVLDNTDDKVVIWSRFRPITDILGQLYPDQAVIFNGTRSDGYKKLAKWAFNGCDPQDLDEFERLAAKYPTPGGVYRPGSAQFFVGTIDIRSSLGMNLHSDCSRQIFSSFSWLGAANAQAADRLRRVGQKADRVRTEFLLGEDTFEFNALNTVMQNFQDMSAILDGRETLSYKQMQTIITDLRRHI